MWLIHMDHVTFNGHNFEPIQIFISGSEGTAKSNLVKVIYNAISQNIALSL